MVATDILVLFTDALDAFAVWRQREFDCLRLPFSTKTTLTHPMRACNAITSMLGVDKRDYVLYGCFIHEGVRVLVGICPEEYALKPSVKTMKDCGWVDIGCSSKMLPQHNISSQARLYTLQSKSIHNITVRTIYKTIPVHECVNVTTMAIEFRHDHPHFVILTVIPLNGTVLFVVC